MTMASSGLFERHLKLTFSCVVVATLSGPGGAMLRTFDTQTGVLLLEKQLHPPELGHLSEPHFFGKHVVFGSGNSTDVYVLTNGYTFIRMDRKTGEIQWSFTMPDARCASFLPI